MSASTTMTIRVPTEVKGRLEQLARETRRSKSFLAADAVAAYVDRELEIVEGIKQGLRDMETGNLVNHEDAVAEMKAVIAEARAAHK